MFLNNLESFYIPDRWKNETELHLLLAKKVKSHVTEKSLLQAKYEIYL